MLSGIASQAITFAFLGAMAVLIIMNAKNFSTAFGAVGSVFTQETSILSGSGYQKSK